MLFKNILPRYFVTYHTFYLKKVLKNLNGAGKSFDVDDVYFLQNISFVSSNYKKLWLSSNLVFEF